MCCYRLQRMNILATFSRINSYDARCRKESHKHYFPKRPCYNHTELGARGERVGERWLANSDTMCRNRYRGRSSTRGYRYELLLTWIASGLASKQLLPPASALMPNKTGARNNSRTTLLGIRQPASNPGILTAKGFLLFNVGRVS